MDTRPYSSLLYDLRQRLARLVVEHEPEFLGQRVEREIANFMATVPPSQARRLRFAVNAMLRGMMVSDKPSRLIDHDPPDSKQAPARTPEPDDSADAGPKAA